MTHHRHGSSIIEFPSDLEVSCTRDFEAPIDLVFDVFWKPEHLRRTIAPFGEEVTVCEVDLRVGGAYHYVFVTDEGVECSFRGTFLEVERPTRTVETWLFEGWPDAEAVETMELREIDGGTNLSWTLAFRDQAGRDHMTKYDGIESNFDNVEKYLRSLVEERGTAS
ncbi:MAG TPA: SRPBCC domain-containing protein [Nocardioides sp.]|uniref:SRPBCC domain-containing protein n=1 Tax=Nocardioides sp. TaxID=35761 RepID=UPI002E2ECAD3|nr:SRPBCC domain-containing protein [Nocardioides sp.]HEX5088159.1 SRPBCC domain-containing protein [Nocardioides sp.]